VNHTSVDIELAIDTFLLLLLGIGPKIVLVPFLEVTAAIDSATKAQVVRKMLTTAGVVGLFLAGRGELLSRLLHFSTGSLSVAGGIILVIIAVTMVLGTGDAQESKAIKGRDPMRIAVFPLAAVFFMVVVLLGVVLALDIVVLRWANRISGHLDGSRMLVTGKIFGVLLAALAVQLMLNGLDSVGVIHLTSH
jgi:small neutral amino acid transporter SnatA (MarC family)